MDLTMDNDKLKALAAELAKGLKTPADLSAFSAQLTKLTVEAALNAEMDHHLGYAAHEAKGRNSGNSRNGFTAKTLKGDHGEIRINTPRDRLSNFEPRIIAKGQTRITGMDDQILSLYARGMSTRDIVGAFQEMYGADISAGLVSQVTNAVIDQVNEWQNRPLNAIYPIVFLDCIVIKIRHDKRVINKSVYLALGINLEGQKELLGLWIAETEGAKFWLQVLTELQNRGVQDILIACVDGLTGFPDAINAVFPATKVQLCVVHMVRNSLKYVSWKDYKAVTADLKVIYRAPTGQAATTNAIESLNSVIRKSVKTRKLFPSDESAMKVIYLAIQAASRKWTMPIKHWRLAMNRFIIDFGDRLTPYV